jgi:hypothetical protein
MKAHQYFIISCTSLCLALLLCVSNATAQSKNSKYACAEVNPAQSCTSANTCGSASNPCSVDVKKTSESASATPKHCERKG